MIVRWMIALALLAETSRANAAESIDALSWLEGHWKSEAFGGTIEEIWLPTAGNAMHGVFRLTAEGALNFSEFLQITEVDGDVIMRFKHYRPDYSTWEGDAAPMELRLTEVTPLRALFEAANETTPDRIEYLKVGDELHVTVTGIGEVLRFRRVR